ncbi:unnamed protein product [Didymodactylos carnosus]|uniref:histone acetyltransferase n=1 Tax=Didymodactylos carnosus TaxID=1234261 RepID=A0A814W2L6_9BILA|nr:unnamed protein product [Didymodactylos carnosus]CAF3960957.1 unnamed protein product [Didymodactylos carnosus]
MSTMKIRSSITDMKVDNQNKRDFSEILTCLNSSLQSTHIEHEQQSVEEPPLKPVKVDSASERLSKSPVKFTQEELRLKLEDVIHKMLATEVSYPFRQPVDPVALNILDYPLIITHPMDISTIHKKLLSAEYDNPFDFVDDMWLMFNNAWTYNKKTTKIYKMCLGTIDPIMQSMGYCCGRQYAFLPRVIFCYGNNFCCQIAPNNTYYYYNNSGRSRINMTNDRYMFCNECFDAVNDETIWVGDDPNQSLIALRKCDFIHAKNDAQEPEFMISCTVCSRRWHQICALYLDQIRPEGFVCETCIKDHNIVQKDNQYVAHKLSITELSNKLEQRVNDFLRMKCVSTGRVTIRMLNASNKVCKVKPKLKKYYPNQVPDDYPYQAKAIFAFQEIDSVDVVFFAMHVQEYDRRCQAPNTKRIYISYLDSVNYFRPRQYQTDICQEILIGYLDYARQMDYLYVHICVRPPNEDDNFIFYYHRLGERVPKPKSLRQWYQRMLDRAISEHIDIMKDCMDNQTESVFDIPYFDGDFWTDAIEESIEKLEQEEERRGKGMGVKMVMQKRLLDDPIEPDDLTNTANECISAKTNKRKNLEKTASARKIAKIEILNRSDLLSKIFIKMKKHKEVFFVIHLRCALAVYPTTKNSDVLIHCKLMDTRDTFLNFAREKQWEFSSLRRAKFSTMVLLHELHSSTSVKYTYICAHCSQQCDDQYRSEMYNFDLCEKCYSQVKHEHEMARIVHPSLINVKNDENNVNNSSPKSLICPTVQRQQSMQHYIETLLHAANCQNFSCSYCGCLLFKRVIRHTKECNEKKRQCNICKQALLLFYYHAKICEEQNCQVPFCEKVKIKIRKQRLAHDQIR